MVVAALISEIVRIASKLPFHPARPIDPFEGILISIVGFAMLVVLLRTSFYLEPWRI